MEAPACYVAMLYVVIAFFHGVDRSNYGDGLALSVVRGVAWLPRAIRELWRAARHAFDD